MKQRPLTFSLDAPHRTLRVTGEVGELSGAAFREAIAQYSAEYTQDLVIDLSDVEFLPSLGVGLLAVALQRAEETGSRIELVAAQGTIAERVLNITGLPHRHE